MLNAKGVLVLVLFVMLSVFTMVPGDVFASDKETETETEAEVKTETELARVTSVKMAKGFAGNYIAAVYAANINDFQNAFALYRKAQAKDADNLAITEQLIIFATIRGYIDEALQYTDEIVSVIDTHGISRMLRLAEAVRSSKFDQAMANVEVLGSRGSSDLIPSILKGWIYLGQGQVEKALTQIRSVPSTGVASVIQDYNAALIADIGGWPIIANARYRSAFNSDFSGQRVGEAYINFLLRQGNMPLARTIRQSFEENFDTAFIETLDRDFALGEKVEPLVKNAQDGVAEAFFDIGTIHFREKNYIYSAFYNQIARYLSPTFDRARVREADISLLVSESPHVDITEEAVTIYQAVEPASPYYYHARSQIGAAYLLADKKDQAEAHLKALVKDFPKKIPAFLQFAAFLSNEERYEEASNILQARINDLGKVDESHFQLFFRAGAAFERAKKWSQAEDMLQTALALAPDNGLILNYLGYSWVDRGENLALALQMIEKAVELRPNDGFIIDSLGWAYYRLKRFHLAIIYLEEAVSRTAGDPHIQDHLGDAYWRVGREDEARFQWSHALELSPEPDLEAKIRLKLKHGLHLTDADHEPPLPIPPGPRSTLFIH